MVVQRSLVFCCGVDVCAGRGGDGSEFGLEFAADDGEGLEGLGHGDDGRGRGRGFWVEWGLRVSSDGGGSSGATFVGQRGSFGDISHP